MNPYKANSTIENHKKPLSLLVFGAGAIGTYIGGSLLLSDNRAVFLERPAVAGRLRAQGLRIEIDQHIRHIPSPLVAENIQEALQMGPFDAAIFALKAYDTQSAIADMQPYQAQIPVILCLQNGIEGEAVLRNAIGTHKVIAGVVTSAIGRKDIGNIIVEKKRGIGIAAGHPLSPILYNALVKAGLNARQYPQESDMKWSKLLTNLLANASCAILDMSPTEVLTHPALYRLEIEQLRETLRVMHAMNISVRNLPGTPVSALALATQYLPPSLSQPIISQAAGTGRGAKMPSFHIDLFNKKGKTEVGYLNGAVLRQAERLQIPAPVNKLLNDTLLGITQGSIYSQNFVHQPQALYTLWDRTLQTG